MIGASPPGPFRCGSATCKVKPRRRRHRTRCRHAPAPPCRPDWRSSACWRPAKSTGDLGAGGEHGTLSVGHSKGKGSHDRMEPARERWLSIAPMRYAPGQAEPPMKTLTVYTDYKVHTPIWRGTSPTPWRTQAPRGSNGFPACWIFRAFSAVPKSMRTHRVIRAERNAHQWRRVRYLYMDCRRQARRRGLTIRGPRKIWD